MIRLGMAWTIVALTVWLGGCALHAATSGGVVVTDTPSAAASPSAASPRFTERERSEMRAYFRSRPQRPAAGAPRPLIARGAHLPSGVRAQPLPSALEVRLPRLPQAYTRVIVGNDVALIEGATRLVHDIAVGILAE